MRKQFCQIAVGNCYCLKLPKCWLQFKRNKSIVSFITIFGARSFPIATVIHSGEGVFKGGLHLDPFE